MGCVTFWTPSISKFGSVREVTQTVNPNRKPNQAAKPSLQSMRSRLYQQQSLLQEYSSKAFISEDEVKNWGYYGEEYEDDYFEMLHHAFW
jgi:hypothetical protein